MSAQSKIIHKSPSSAGKLDRNLSLTMCVILVMGSVIGSGIFTMTGNAIGMVGVKVPFAFLMSSIFVILTNIPLIFQSGALPATGGFYIYVSRFVHPTLGYIHILNSLMGIFNIPLMATTTAMYMQPLMPSVPTHIAAGVFIILLAIVGNYGVKVSGILQNIIIIVMSMALLTFIIPGLNQVESQFVTIGEALFPGTLKFASLWSAVAILRYSLSGGGVIFTLGDEVKNPGFTIPAAFFIGTTIVTIIYCLIGYVTVGVLPLEQVANQPLWVAAGAILGENSGAFKFFIVGGALFATITTLNGSFMIYSRTMFAAAKDGVLPKVLAKTNKHGVPHIAIGLCTIIGLTIVLLKLTVSELLNFTAVPGLILGFIYYLPPIMIMKKLPNCAKNAWFKIPNFILIPLSIGSAVLLFSLGTTLFARMKSVHYIGMVVFYGLGFIYWVFRVKYLRKRGIDLIANMKGLHPYWIELEEKYATNNKASNVA